MEWMETALLAMQLACLLCLQIRLGRTLDRVLELERVLAAPQAAPEREEEPEPGTVSAAMLEGFDALMGYSERTARGAAR